MTKELTRIDRATRFAVGIRGADADSALILKGDDILDAKALAEEFVSLLERWNKKANQAREAGKLGGRPKLKKSNKGSISKRTVKRRS